MALTFSVAGLQAELDAVNTAIQSEDWSTARKEALSYGLVYRGIAERGSLGSLSYSLPKPDDLLGMIEELRQATQRTSVKRLIRTQTGYSNG